MPSGEMVEWSITAVLKTAVPRGTGGSNPSLSAKGCKSTSYVIYTLYYTQELTSCLILVFLNEVFYQHIQILSYKRV